MQTVHTAQDGDGVPSIVTIIAKHEFENTCHLSVRMASMSLVYRLKHAGQLFLSRQHVAY